MIRKIASDSGNGNATPCLINAPGADFRRNQVN